jgi:hypothetical protein
MDKAGNEVPHIIWCICHIRNRCVYNIDICIQRVIGKPNTCNSVDYNIIGRTCNVQYVPCTVLEAGCQLPASSSQVTRERVK